MATSTYVSPGYRTEVPSLGKLDVATSCFNCTGCIGHQSGPNYDPIVIGCKARGLTRQGVDRRPAYARATDILAEASLRG